jgi:predicted O-linked N-acetylglucosamine transferase (SPINDLY family)
MRLQAQKVTTFISNSSQLWHKVRIKAVDRSLRKVNTIYNKIWRRGSKKPEDFLYSALSSHQRNDAEHAICTLEAGLKNYPGAERLLENYLRICCEQEQFARVTDFINPTNKQLCQTLAGLHISSDREKHAIIWLTEKIINKNFDDVVSLWRLADLLEYAGEKATVNRIYQRLSKRVTNNPEDYLYAGLSEMRLDNVEDGFKKFELGLTAYPEAESIRSAFKQCCYIRFDFDRYLQLKSILNNEEVGKSISALNFYRSAFKYLPPEAFLLKFKDIELKCSTHDYHVLKEEFLEHLREHRVTIESAKLSIFFSRYLDLDVEFSENIFLVLYSLNWGSDDKAEKYLLTLVHKLTLPIAPHHTSELEEIVRKFAIDAQALAQKPMDMTEPISDLGKHWYPWQSLFCLVQPRLYRHAMSAFEMLAFRLWPRLDYIAPHIQHPLASREITNRKIRIGFTVLDSMPMMSGFMELLDKNIFETVFLRPGPIGESRTASDWVARAGTTVEYSDTDAYSAINTIANQELDILISGPSAPQLFFPLMARLAHLHMVLLEPNWPDGIKNSDYYISWQMAEPENYKDFYKTRVSLLQNPPYWIEKSSLGEISAISDETRNNIRQRLLGLGPQERFYICANTTPKVHPVMDEMLYKLLENDPVGYLVFLRGEHAISQALKARLEQKLGIYYKRVIFLNTLKRDDAHSLLLSADCCIDSYPIGGMSSSFDGLMLGAPIVTLPADIPFGRWTAAIYEYIGVSDLTARNIDEYISIAMRLAIDKDWRLKKSAEIREKSSRYIESRVSFDEFQHFIIQAWRRKQAGLPPENWVAGEWQ